MTPYKLLEKCKEYLEQLLTEHNYKLRTGDPDQILNQRGAAPTPGADREIIPSVHIGSLPHENFREELPLRFFAAPYILVGMDEDNQDYNESMFSMLIQVCTYSQDDYDPVGTDKPMPDNLAYLDALNLLQFLRSNLVQQRNLAESVIRMPIKMGMYATQAMTWPLAFGYLSFDIAHMDETPQLADYFQKG